MGAGAVSSAGGLLTLETLDRVVGGDQQVPGMSPDDYGLSTGGRLREAMSSSWLRLAETWAAFRRAEVELSEAGEAETGLTRELWLVPLLRDLGFNDLRAVRSLSPDDDGKSYAISHEWRGRVPIHLMGWRTPIDRRTPGRRGASSASPHGLLQEFLNRSDSHLWGVVSNGRVLRLLRDNASLTRQAYVEFDLEAIFGGESFADFRSLWLCCHSTRFEADSTGRCLLERWREFGIESGARALDRLRDGVETAIRCLGDGLLAHPANVVLRRRVRSGAVAPDDLLNQLLRVAYRMLFLLVAESRDLLSAPDAAHEARARYRDYYSMSRLCDLGRDRRGSSHSDLWQGLLVTMDALDAGDDATQERTRQQLGLTSLGGMLWSRRAISDVAESCIDNAHLLEAVRSLAFVYDEEANALRRVDYQNMGTEELGSVYESLLELHADVDLDDRAFRLTARAGTERKTTGSYYTPPALISHVLDNALEPAIDEAKAQPDPQASLLALRVLDPACGSGHFLIAAAQRIAHALASVRGGGAQPSPEESSAALREVVGRCLYGIDINPMAVELCKVSLWLESNTPGKPLSFLDHRIIPGNSLLGVSPRLLDDGIPDEAFKPQAGDDKHHARALRARNRNEHARAGQGVLGPAWSPSADTAHMAEALRRMDAAPDDTAQQVAAKQAQHDRLRAEGRATKSKLLADAWCAAFAVAKTPEQPAITEGLLQALEAASPEQVRDLVAAERRGTGTDATDLGERDAVAAILRLADELQFTHLHVAFPDVFNVPEELSDASNESAGWSSGFDAVVGNPPFLNQLRDLTSTQARAASLQACRCGGLAKGYADAAYLFMALACEAVHPEGGRVGLVQPESLLAADGASALRHAIALRTTIESLWVAGEKVFSANVLTCAVTVRSGQSRRPEPIRRSVGARFEALPELEVSMAEVARMPTWGPLIAEGFGVPRVQLDGDARLGDVATATADFRDQYYGLQPFVIDAEEAHSGLSPDAGTTLFAPLITVGLIDPLHNMWGETPTRFAKKKWRAPAVDIERLRSDSDLGEWADRRLVPKLLVATQTPVLEVMPDEKGTLLPSVPVITVIPLEISLWHIAALLSAPPLTAWAAARYLGASLSTSALKLSARQIEDLPLPPPSQAWDDAAAHAKDAFESDSARARSAYLRRLAQCMCEAFGIEDSNELIAWWTDRLPEREDHHPERATADPTGAAVAASAPPPVVEAPLKRLN